VDRIRAEIELAYVNEDEPLAAKHRQRLRQAEEEVQDRRRRYNARKRRADECVTAVESYPHERARDLITEREDDGKRLATELQATLEALPLRLDTPLIFAAPQGKLLNLDNWRRPHWAPAIEGAGMRKPAPMYDLRSTFASDALAAGVSVFELARIMAASVRMIERHYGALLDGAGAGIAGRSRRRAGSACGSCVGRLVSVGPGPLLAWEGALGPGLAAATATRR
jgi:hypothetical protein